MKQELKIITPNYAALLLKNQRNPRKLSQWHVSEFTRHIKQGTFETTHQGIALDVDGRLVDGQHRLSGVVEAGKDVMMWVASDVSDDAIIVTDRGSRRTAADFLHIHKHIAQPVNLAAAIESGTSRPSEFEIVKMNEVIGETLDVLIGVYPGSKRGVSAPVRLGCALNIMLDQSKQQEIAAQFLFYCTGKFEDMWPSVQSLVRRLMTNGGRIDQKTDLSCALKAFKYKNKDINSIRVTNLPEDLRLIRTILKSLVSK